jgi:ribosome-binding protein aMBF1 (putative translation factor)
MKYNISKFQTFENFKTEALLGNAEVKAEYDKLGPRYEVIRQLIKARNKSKLTQKEVANRMGTKQSALARFEAGNTNPTLDFVQKLARALETTFVLKIS